jgi:hypothetical protein
MSFWDKAFDSPTYGIHIIESDHAMIHQEKFYTVGQTTSSLGASSWIDFYLVPSTAKELHLKQLDATMSGGLLEVFICEGLSTGSSVVGTGGTTCISFNRDRNSTNTCINSIYKNTTWSSTAGGITSTQVTNIISHFYIGTTGTASNRLGASESNNLEWILKQGTTTIIRIYNDGAAGAASLRLHFYEV